MYNTISIGNDDYLNAYQNQAFIGNTHMTFIGGAVTWSTYSDARIKNTIQEDVKGLDFITKLRPVTYHISSKAITAITGGKETPDYPGKYDCEKIKHSGFIAQEVEKAAKESGYEFSGYSAPKNQWSLYTISYEEFVVPLVKAVQELSKMNDQKDAKIDDLEQKIAKLELFMNVTPTSISSASLLQNIPNPFAHTTTINYILPQTYSSAKIIVTDKSGKTLKQINVSGSKGSVSIDASTLASGAYQYALYVDGRLIDTKQMVLAK